MYINNNEENSAKTIFMGALALSLATLVVKILGVVYKVPIFYLLGDEGMGYFNSAYTIYGFFYILCTAGVPKAVTVLITEANAKEQYDFSERIYDVTFRLFLVVGIAVFTVLALFSRSLSIYFGNSGAAASLVLIAPSIIFVCISGVLRGYYNSFSRLGPVAASHIIEAVAKLVLGIAFAYLGVRKNYTIPYISALAVFGISMGAALSAVYLIIYRKRIKPAYKTGQKTQFNDFSIIKSVVKIAFPITLASSVLSISSLLDLVIIMKGLKRIGYAEALASATYGNYTTLVVPMLNLVVSLITPLAIAALPHLRECHLKKDNSGFVNISENTVRVVALFTVPCAFLFFLYPYTILDVLFTPIASVKGAAALSLLSPAVFLLSLLTLYNTFLEAKGMFYVPIISSAFGTVVKLIISFVFIDELGIIASPIGSSASYFVSLLISSMFFKDGLNRRLVRCFFYPLIISTLFILIPFYLVFYLEILPLYRNFELFYISAFSFLYFIFAILPIMRLKKSGLICKIEQK